MIDALIAKLRAADWSEPDSGARWFAGLSVAEAHLIRPHMTMRDHGAEAERAHIIAGLEAQVARAEGKAP